MSELVRRKTLRLNVFDYTSLGAYFVTICTHERRNIFGEIRRGVMGLNKAGCLAWEAWRSIPERFTSVETDPICVVMPNHMHGIIWIAGSNHRRGEVHSPGAEGGETPPLQRPNLGSVIAFFKYQCAKNINKLVTNQQTKIWQRNYYDRIIRDDRELQDIRAYVLNNPNTWEADQYH